MCYSRTYLQRKRSFGQQTCVLVASVQWCNAANSTVTSTTRRGGYSARSPKRLTHDKIHHCKALPDPRTHHRLSSLHKFLPNPLRSYAVSVRPAIATFRRGGHTTSQPTSKVKLPGSRAAPTARPTALPRVPRPTSPVARSPLPFACAAQAPTPGAR